MAPDVAGEAMRAWAEETNRLNRECSASSETERERLADIGKKIDGIVLTPGAKRSALQETLRCEFGNILERTGGRAENEKSDTPLPGMSVSVVGIGFEPCNVQSMERTLRPPARTHERT